MATVKEIMNPKLLYIRDGDRVSLARRHILEFGITAVPVLDETHRPVGIVSLRDLAGEEGESFEPKGNVTTVLDTDSVEVAAKTLAESTYHHLVVVDAKGVAVGMVSAVDFLRSLLGLAPRHPAKFDAV